MSRHDRYLLGLVLARWGFAAMVAVAIAVGLFAAATVTPPMEVPTVALRAAAASGLPAVSDEALSGDFAMEVLEDLREEVDDLQIRLEEKSSA